MGGTSTDVAVCVSGRPEITRETNVGDFPVRAPAVDVASIGAGGGSIAYVAEATGALRVGPESAGADPGPGVLRPRRDGRDGHRRERRARPPAAAAAGRRDRARRRRRLRAVARGRRGARRRRRGDRPRDRRAWSTRPCSARCASSPCSGAGCRASSRSSPFGGAGGLHANALARDPRLLPGDRAGGVRRALGARASSPPRSRTSSARRS